MGMGALPAEERKRIMEVRRATLARSARSGRSRSIASDEIAGASASGRARVVALVAAAVSLAAAWLGFPGVLFNVTPSLREWLMPLVQ